MPLGDLLDARSLDDLTEHLVVLRAHAGNPSYAEIVRRVGVVRARRGVRTGAPGRVTVYDAFRPGRSRMDIELIADIVTALGRPGDVATWRRAYGEVVRTRARERNGRISAGRARVAVGAPSAADGLVVSRRGLVDEVSQHLDAEREGPIGVGAAVITGLPGCGKSMVARAVGAELVRRHPEASVVAASMRTHAPGSPDDRADPGDVADEIARLRDRGERLGDGPLIVLLDDVASFEDVSVVAGALPDGSVVVATSRSTFATPQRVLDVALAPLTPEEGGELLRHLLGSGHTSDADTPFLRRLALLCGGLPLSLDLLAAQIRERPGWSLSDHADRLAHVRTAEIAPGLDAAYSELPPLVRQTLNLVAAHPSRLSRTEIAAYLAPVLDDGDAARAQVPVVLDELLRHHFLSVAADGRLDQHDVVRALAAERADLDEPLSLRRKAATALSDAMLDPLRGAVIDASHLQSVEDTVDVHIGTVRLLSETGQTTSARLHAETIHPGLMAAQRYADALRADEFARRAVAPARDNDIERRIAEALLALGRTAEAEVVLTSIVGDDDPLVYRTLGLLGAAANQSGDHPKALEATERALEAARTAGDRHYAAMMVAQAGEMLLDLGRAEQSLAMLDELLSDGMHEHPLVRITALIMRSSALICSDRLDDARADVELARDEASRLGHRSSVLFCDAWHGWILSLSGDAAQGRRELEAAEAAFAESGRAKPHTSIALRLVDALLADGDLEAAEIAAQDVVAETEHHRFHDNNAYARILLARVWVRRGLLDDADGVLRAVQAETVVPRLRVEAGIAAGELARARGDEDAARAIWTRALALEPDRLFARQLTGLLAGPAAAPSA